MTQDAATRAAGARSLADTIFEETDATGHSNHDDLVAAIGALDDRMDAVLSTLTQTRTVKQTLLDALPEPFKSNSTALEKAHALISWSLNEVN